MLRNEIETCPYCGTENAFWWDTEKYGYQAVCKECGVAIMLCDACKHSEDNEGQKCDWSIGTGCFRKLSGEETNGEYNLKMTAYERMILGDILLQEYKKAADNIDYFQKKIYLFPSSDKRAEKVRVEINAEEMATVNKLYIKLLGF